jgi:hypothetical protein
MPSTACPAAEDAEDSAARIPVVTEQWFRREAPDHFEPLAENTAAREYEGRLQS